jgi:hypothetical protein
VTLSDANAFEGEMTARRHIQHGIQAYRWRYAVTLERSSTSVIASDGYTGIFDGGWLKWPSKMVTQQLLRLTR